MIDFLRLLRCIAHGFKQALHLSRTVENTELLGDNTFHSLARPKFPFKAITNRTGIYKAPQLGFLILRQTRNGPFPGGNLESPLPILALGPYYPAHISLTNLQKFGNL